MTIITIIAIITTIITITITITMTITITIITICIRQILEKKWEYDSTIHQLFIDFKIAYDSVKREVLYNILTEFGIPKKLVRLIKMCLVELIVEFV